jgi:hypothetical protein
MSAQLVPTLEWLQKARAAVNADPAFRKRGSIDVKMGVHAGDSTFLVTFAGFSCHGVETMPRKDLRDADFIIDMNAEQWDRFLTGRRSGTGRTLIDVDTTDGVVKAQTPRKRLDFLRYHTSIQAFFDAGVAGATSRAA